MVKCLRGATTNDMRSYIQSTLENSPERICLHIGTYDLKNKEPREVADAIVDLARTVESSGDFEILISEVTPWNDKYKEVVKSVNKLLNKFCNQLEWKLIRNTNNAEKLLNRGGLHLTRQGNDLLYGNCVKSLPLNVNNH